MDRIGNLFKVTSTTLLEGGRVSVLLEREWPGGPNGTSASGGRNTMRLSLEDAGLAAPFLPGAVFLLVSETHA